MTNAHIYFVAERQSISIGNWSALITLFEAMGTNDSPMPAFNNHWRIRLDGDAVIYESKFDTSEVSLEAFKQLLADEFGVDVGDIESVISSADYAEIGTTVWQFKYNSVDRFKVERFGAGGATWQQSGDECRGYLAANRDEWDQIEI